MQEEIDLAVDPASITPELVQKIEGVTVAPDAPGDFDSFWLETLAQLDEIPLALEIEPCPSPPGFEDIECAVWSADSFGGRQIAGPLTMPRSGFHALWVYGHGYGDVASGAAWRPEIARQGFAAIGVDARGFARSRRPGDPAVPGWITKGIESIRSYILRGAVMDTVRAVQVARSLPGADRCRTVLTGFSFSGGLAVMAAPWIPDLGYIAVGVPTFGAYDLRRTLVKGGSGAELNRLLDGLDEGAVRALRERLRYFDAVNFAARIEGVPVTVGYGVVDPIVPAETVVAIYHALAAADKELLSFPCAHYDHPLLERWAGFDRHIVERACSLFDLT